MARARAKLEKPEGIEPVEPEEPGASMEGASIPEPPTLLELSEQILELKETLGRQPTITEIREALHNDVTESEARIVKELSGSLPSRPGGLLLGKPQGAKTVPEPVSEPVRAGPIGFSPPEEAMRGIVAFKRWWAREGFRDRVSELQAEGYSGSQARRQANRDRETVIEWLRA